MLPIFILISLISASQPIDSILAKINPQKFSSAVHEKLQKLERKILAKTQKTLDKLEEEEEKICKNHFADKDSRFCDQQLVQIKQKYLDLQNKLRRPSPEIPKELRLYLPHLDSLNVAFKLLQQKGGDIGNTISVIENFGNKMQQVEEVRQFIRERFRYWNELATRSGVIKNLKSFNKQAYYYYQQLISIKQMLNEPGKLEKKCLEILSQTKIFREFMEKNSLLASLFRPPVELSDPIALAGLSGLQSRAQVNNLLQEQLGTINAQATIRENVQQAQACLQQLKLKMERLGTGNSQEIPPEQFRPNSQKTKSFFNRLEIGANFQSQRSNGWFPTISDIGLSIGYKLNDKSVAGLGFSYKVGWGEGFRNIQLTAQGQSFRSFIDLKLKASFWLTGCFEVNYTPQINNQSVASTVNRNMQIQSWQKSGLLGLSKTVSVRTKFFKQTKIQLLWNFLSYQQLPRASPVVLRFAYNFH